MLLLYVVREHHLTYIISVLLSVLSPGKINLYFYPMVCFSCLHCHQVLALPTNMLYFGLHQLLGYFSNINS